MIPRFDLEALIARDPAEMARLGVAVREVGFLTLGNTALGATEVERVLDAYRRFFRLPEARKRSVDMARTGANRGWGGPKSEQVDPGANPDFKEVFDCGRELPEGHPMAARNLPVYAPNLWPEDLPGFRPEIESYFASAMDVAMDILRALSAATGGDGGAFDRAFDPPMALLRGNYYPPRPDWAGDKDFGIAAHTDYGCLTLLATDGVPGLEVRMPSGDWLPVRADPGEFIINFGEMLEFWTDGAAKATLHRVQGGPEERISVPLFFNPSFDANVAPPGSGQLIRAGDHLNRRFAETYVHLQHKA
ncbi:isopenicillin N synthase family oxygenase [Ponticoccus sp. SC2-23]|uniref:isopenicillin N synthase family dioxygenase n=1 Tax=Alexandriicola marinus TaxID=2081710 RepID=UPI000FDA41E9|nr:2-oxoglutarate and iron-dependent oxygenase domain-containing protein [Alexandriicola marinus]MBM1219334.1 isopenicillin N synthase family oxygenase [Ponticoccus sp. SC6-9]MBM1223594.1 isopenicillin N synthase family oxygenase [Ponticoccus sp. SC6-15]MBM1229147.1 isopenicillin N synthase family oxygenase [Ponticoccus sp. SC6-38]MBM1232560.1 isopenicillin N synthase family oxygenase [Ponticoccus sp. SC6-45]MBM1237490.1 isopenicillin N synthase family oxygenase [Ponticoccus sp. SC6-49]MBM124